MILALWMYLWAAFGYYLRLRHDNPKMSRTQTAFASLIWPIGILIMLYDEVRQ